MAGRDGFQPCTMDTGALTPMPLWERKLVTLAFLVHVVDVGLDLLVCLLFVAHLQWGFFCGAAGVILWAWLVSSCYVSFGGSSGASADSGDFDGDGGGRSRIPQFILSFAQVQIFTEAYRCIFRNGDTEYFYTLRLMEAILESAPGSLVQLYALVVWAGTETAPVGAAPLLRLSVMFSFISVGTGLALWEQRVQFRTPAYYVGAVSLMRAFEIASRSLTLALFAGVTQPYGFWWALLLDYVVMLFLIVQHQSVQFTYGLFMAVVLVLVSLEPLVWCWEDHAVPKDSYYLVRIIEFVIMWILIIHWQDNSDVASSSSSIWLGCQAVALISTLGLYVMLPFVWKIARRHELTRDVVDWGEEESKEGLHQGDAYSDSLSSSGSEEGARGVTGAGDNDGELPPE